MSKMANSVPSLIIAGPSGAGKTTVASLLSARFGIAAFELGHHVISEARQRGLADSPASIVSFANAEIQAGRKLLFAQALTPRLSSPCIVVGPRQLEEVRYLREFLGRSVLIFLTAKSEVRKRRRFDLWQSFSGSHSWLDYRDSAELDWGLDRVRQAADLVLENEGPVESQLRCVERRWGSGSVATRLLRATRAILSSPQIPREELDSVLTLGTLSKAAGG